MSLLRNVLQRCQRGSGLLQGLRKFSVSASCNQSSSVDVTVDSATGVATLKMQRPPVNSLTLELLTEMCIAVDKLDSEKCRGLILGSGVKNIFSAGLDIGTMYQPDEPRLREFWRTLQEIWIKLYGSQMVTVAAISGHSPAGGCLLSMCCDHRIMAEGRYTIGLNETLLGIVAPTWFQDTLVNTVGHREAERALQLGLLYTPEQALSIGMIDSISKPEDLENEANEAMKKWLKIPAHARHITKLQLRQSTIDRLVKNRQEDIDHFVNFIMKDTIQKSLGMYVAALKKKGGSK